MIHKLSASEARSVLQQYVYGPNHIDELVMVRGRSGALFVYQDPNWNVIALTTTRSTLAEENSYTPYGQLVVRRLTAFGDTDGDGDVDAADNTAWTATQGGGGVYNRHLDADLDGDNDTTMDKVAFDVNYLAPGDSVEVSGRAWSPTGVWFGYTARQLDPETGLLHYRARAYSPFLHQFAQRDPIGYLDSASLYQYVGGHPLYFVDPLGLYYAGPDRLASTQPPPGHPTPPGFGPDWTFHPNPYPKPGYPGDYHDPDGRVWWHDPADDDIHNPHWDRWKRGRREQSKERVPIGDKPVFKDPEKEKKRKEKEEQQRKKEKERLEKERQRSRLPRWFDDWARARKKIDTPEGVRELQEDFIIIGVGAGGAAIIIIVAPVVAPVVPLVCG